MRFFNTAGPVNVQDHYYLPPLERFGLDDIFMLIAQKKYFVLHAPRQTGKTSALLALMTRISMPRVRIGVSTCMSRSARRPVKMLPLPCQHCTEGSKDKTALLLYTSPC